MMRLPEFDSAALLAQAPLSPGVYRMYNAKGTLLYVGKAKRLKNRLASYFVKRKGSVRLEKMVAQIADVQVTMTTTEAEALLLESNLIKQHRPRYNILLRDDKSYPYVHVSSEVAYPRLSFYRGSRKQAGRYFGPYPSAASVRFTLGQLQKVFKIRLCEESYFNNRSRPCLQYQIKRCSAPCVGAITQQAYAADIADSIRFLEGKSEALIQERVSRMEQAAECYEYEQAAVYRDQIEQLRQISQQQYISGAKGDVDIIAALVEAGTACVQVFYIRSGNSLGNRSFFPKLPDGPTSTEEVLSAFIGQYYSTHDIPVDVIVNTQLHDLEVLQEMLFLKREGKVKLTSAVRGQRAHWLEMARQNAAAALSARLQSQHSQRERLEALQDALSLDAVPQRMECFDISHTMGEATVASCVVFDENGPKNSDYRRFNITGITPGDDYAAMRQALLRRYKRQLESGAALPDILFIDGGRGQLSEAQAVLAQLAIQGVTLVGVAKGEGRKPGLETLFVNDRHHVIHLPPHAQALHLVQQIRDEAHRFAITGHRRKRAKSRVTSTLEEIPGLGPKRRQSLLKQFGGIRGIFRASVEELEKVPGISKKLAEQVYAVYHPENHP